MKPKFDKVILSSNENPKYIQFWPLVSWAWKTLFDVDVHMAFVTNRSSEDLYITELKAHGCISVYPEIEGIPSANNAKMARHHLASTFGDSICLVNDIDLLPLQTEYITDIMSNFRSDCILCVGADVYIGSTDEGKFPIGYMTASGNVFKQIVNPNDFDYVSLLKSYVGFRMFDHKEDVSRNVDNEDPDTFSDESLFRAIISRWNNADKVIHISRGFNPYRERAICRASWENDPQKLASGVYVEAHLSRPFDKYMNQFIPLIEHLKAK